MPTKYKGMWPKFGRCEKGRSLQGYWNQQREMEVATLSFREDYPRILTKLLTSTYREGNKFAKILIPHGKWCNKNHSWSVFNNKIVPTALLASPWQPSFGSAKIQCK